MIIRIFGLILLSLLSGAVLFASNNIDKFDRTSENVLPIEASVTLQVEEKEYVVETSEGNSVYIVMEKAQEQGFMFDGKEFSGLGYFVEEIDGIRQNPKDRMYWIYYVNNEKAQVGVSLYKIEDKDVITFKYEEME